MKRALASASLAACALALPCGAALAADGAGTAVMVTAGLARTPDEIRLCREEEASRAAKRPGPRVRLPDAPLRLRSASAAIPRGGCGDAVRTRNFFVQGNRERGCFVNAFVRPGEPPVIADLSTGLAWATPATPKVEYSEALARIRALNRDRWAGHSDWRLPTVEEALSLLESADFDDAGHHLDLSLFELRSGESLWTADAEQGGEGHWAVDALLAKCTLLPPQFVSPVRPVRTLTRAEWRAARDAAARAR